MKRCCFCLIAWCMALTTAHAVPARPLYEPPDPPKAPMPIAANLAGSAWLGKYLSTNRIYIFETDGTLSYKSTLASAKIFKNRGVWKLEGNTLSFELQIKQGVTLISFRGTIQDANTIVGESMTKAGGKTQQTLQRTTLDAK